MKLLKVMKPLSVAGLLTTQYALGEKKTGEIDKRDEALPPGKLNSVHLDGNADQLIDQLVIRELLKEPNDSEMDVTKVSLEPIFSERHVSIDFLNDTIKALKEKGMANTYVMAFVLLRYCNEFKDSDEFEDRDNYEEYKKLLLSIDLSKAENPGVSFDRLDYPYITLYCEFKTGPNNTERFSKSGTKSYFKSEEGLSDCINEMSDFLSKKESVLQKIKLIGFDLDSWKNDKEYQKSYMNDFIETAINGSQSLLKSIVKQTKAGLADFKSKM